MNLGKQSRRKFIGMSFILMGIPSIISSLIPLSSNATPSLKKLKSGFKVYKNVPDMERIKELLGQKNPLKWKFEATPDDARAYPAVTWVGNDALITYFNYKGGLSFKLKKLPVDRFYQ